MSKLRKELWVLVKSFLFFQVCFAVGTGLNLLLGRWLAVTTVLIGTLIWIRRPLRDKKRKDNVRKALRPKVPGFDALAALRRTSEDSTVYGVSRADAGTILRFVEGVIANGWEPGQ